MKKNPQFLTLCLTLLLLAFAAKPAQAQRTPGVQAGDWYFYDNVQTKFETNDPTATPPSWLQEINHTTSYNMSITSINNTSIKLHCVEHFNNGTENAFDDHLDIDTGETQKSMLMIIAANLQPNDTLYTSDFYSTWKINETIDRTYNGTIRQTNHINYTLAINLTYVNLYWDKQTGVLVEIHETVITEKTENYTTTIEISFKLTDSNIWIVPELTPPTLILTLTLITALTSATIIKKKKNQSKP